MIKILKFILCTSLWIFSGLIFSMGFKQINSSAADICFAIAFFLLGFGVIVINVPINKGS